MSGRTITEFLADARARTIEHPVTGCWLWTGARNAHGYGVAHWNGRFVRLPRVALAAAFGCESDEELPQRLVTRHRCPGGDRPGCWNPAHLLGGSQRDNLRDRPLREAGS